MSCVAVLVLASCSMHTTWHRFCVLRPPVLPAQLTAGSSSLSHPEACDLFGSSDGVLHSRICRSACSVEIIEFRNFSGFRKSLKLRGPGLTPQKIHAASLWISGLCHSANFPVQGSWSMQTAGSLPGYPPQFGVRRSVSQAEQQPRWTAEFVSTSVKQSPVFFPLLPCSLALSLQFDCKLEQAYSAAARVLPRRPSPGRTTLLSRHPSGMFDAWCFIGPGTPPAVPSLSGRPLSLSPQFCSDSHLVKKFAATVQFSRVLFFLTLSSRPRKWRFVQSRFSFVPHGTVAFSPETYTKVCKWRASKAITKESDESDSSSSTVLNDSLQKHGRSSRVWNKILRTKNTDTFFLWSPLELWSSGFLELSRGRSMKPLFPY